MNFPAATAFQQRKRLKISSKVLEMELSSFKSKDCSKALWYKGAINFNFWNV
jgi:hypothetical protein